MKLNNEARLTDLLRSALLCKDDVIFKTEEGDVLNLKSYFSSLIFQTIAQDKTILANGQIICMSEEDYGRLAEFLE